MARLRHHITSPVLGVFPHLSELTLLSFVAIISRTPFPIRCGLCAHVIENFRQLVGGGGGGGGWPECPPPTAQKGPERAGAGTETRGRHAPGTPGAMLPPS